MSLADLFDEAPPAPPQAPTPLETAPRAPSRAAPSTGPVPPAAGPTAAPSRVDGGPTSTIQCPPPEHRGILGGEARAPHASGPECVRNRATSTEAHDAGREAYVALKSMNWSTLKHMARSPKMFQFRLANPEPTKPAYLFGRAFHAALLEPAAFLERFVVAPDFGNLRTNKAKDARDAWLADNVTREVLSHDDMAQILAMATAVRSHKVARELLDVIVPEKTIEWKDEETGLACKARLDMLGPDFLADVKTSRDPAPRAFARDAADHLYHGQMAFYFDGARTLGLIPKHAEPPFLIVPEKSEPYDVVVFRLHRNLTLEPGRALYRSLLRRFLECSAADWWPGIASELKILELPGWAPGADVVEPPASDFDLLGV